MKAVTPLKVLDFLRSTLEIKLCLLITGPRLEIEMTDLPKSVLTLSRHELPIIRKSGILYSLRCRKESQLSNSPTANSQFRFVDSQWFVEHLLLVCGQVIGHRHLIKYQEESF